MLALVGIIAVLALGTSALTSSVWQGRDANGPPTGQVAVFTGEGHPPGFTTGVYTGPDPYWITPAGEFVVRDREGNRLGTLSCRFVPDDDRGEHPCPPATMVAATPAS